VISANRKLLEDLVYRVRSLELPRRPDAADEHTADVISPGAERRWPR
jgi:hypothetical protein